MKAYRLVESSSNEPVSPLLFLDRSDASRYQKITLLPWENLGYYMTPGGLRIPLAGINFRVEPSTLPGIFDPELDWVIWRIDKILGFSPLIPGRCFDPTTWRTISDHDRRDPIMAPKIAHAERELEKSQRL